MMNDLNSPSIATSGNGDLQSPYNQQKNQQPTNPYSQTPSTSSPNQNQQQQSSSSPYQQSSSASSSSPYQPGPSPYQQQQQQHQQYGSYGADAGGYAGGSTTTPSSMRRRVHTTPTYSPYDSGAGGGYGSSDMGSDSSSRNQYSSKKKPSSGKMSSLKTLDFFPKIETDLTVQTSHGGFLSLAMYGLIVILCITEISSHRASNAETAEHVVVDTALNKRMRINLNMTFPSLACEDLHVDAMDVAGDSQINMQDTFKTIRLYENSGSRIGTTEIDAEVNAKHKADDEKQKILKSKLSDDYCGPCYGAKGDAMDVAGDSQINMQDTFKKIRLYEDGVQVSKTEIDAEVNAKHKADDEKQKILKSKLSDDYCGPCYGAKGEHTGDDHEHDKENKENGNCCQTCDELIDAYKKKKWAYDKLIPAAEQCVREGVHAKKPKMMTQGEGCQIAGYMVVNRVNGNFHIAMGEGVERDGRHIHLFNPEDTKNFNSPKMMTQGEGCQIAGYMVVNRVNGNFHIAMGEGVERDGRHIHLFNPEDTKNFNSSHIIHELSFGEPKKGMPNSIEDLENHWDAEGNVLNGATKIVTEKSGSTGLFQYFVKVVPTVYKNTKGADRETNRFFFTERFRPLYTELEDEHYDLGEKKKFLDNIEADTDDDGEHFDDDDELDVDDFDDDDDDDDDDEDHDGKGIHVKLKEKLNEQKKEEKKKEKKKEKEVKIKLKSEKVTKRKDKAKKKHAGAKIGGAHGGSHDHKDHHKDAEGNVLNGATKIVTEKSGSTGLFQYFVKVVPTVYKNKNGIDRETNRFFFTERFRPLYTDLEKEHYDLGEKKKYMDDLDGKKKNMDNKDAHMNDDDHIDGGHGHDYYYEYHYHEEEEESFTEKIKHTFAASLSKDAAPNGNGINFVKNPDDKHKEKEEEQENQEKENVKVKEEEEKFQSEKAEKDRKTHAGAKIGGAHGGSHDHKDHHKVQNALIPGVFFIYEVYPFAVEISQNSVPLTHLILRIMAVIGGVVTITGW
eukprot:CAMPEP_0194443170 /NCGR_PEP_ID=MMETSP0176-20130528/126551_1 /TAXON_ID=216777 /ORGANISM="Proboscia alata, Strain PI-D3" /LENGTH=1007 /DNA_ID=CAMNT_0039269379 /DNA_START=41 /DNA_END=3061 /DNA_ORIENTATION=-